MKTRRELTQRIEELERALAEEKRQNKRSALINAAGLPPCHDLACCDCRHAVYMYDSWTKSSFLLGCGRARKCVDYEKNTIPFSEAIISVQQECSDLPRYFIPIEQISRADN